MDRSKKYTRRKFVIIIFALAIVILLILQVFLKKSNKLNLLIISIDTLRADHVSCYGYKRSTTPNIDRLASQGHRFSNAYTVMPTTGPAHASLLTSLYPTQLSVRRNGEILPAEATTLAEILADSGYDTAAFVSAWVMNPRYGFGQGFKTYDYLEGATERRAQDTLTKAAEWLKKLRQKPFFLFVHFFDPHGPYLPPGYFRKIFNSGKKHVLKTEWFESYQRAQNSPDYYDFLDRYDGEIAYTDWAIGKLMNQLQTQGLDHDTIVVLVSDHGESLAELATRFGHVFDHGEFLYAHQLEIVMIIRMPIKGTKQHTAVHSDQVSILDIMPTVLEILDIDAPGFMTGHSLVPMMRGEKTSHGPVFAERRTFERITKPYHSGNAYSIIKGKWHLIFSTTMGSELYDLVKDPREAYDLRQEQAKTAEDLNGKLRSWLQDLKPAFGSSEFETDQEAIERLRSLGYTE